MVNNLNKKGFSLLQGILIGLIILFVVIIYVTQKVEMGKDNVLKTVKSNFLGQGLDLCNNIKTVNECNVGHTSLSKCFWGKVGKETKCYSCDSTYFKKSLNNLECSDYNQVLVNVKVDQAVNTCDNHNCGAVLIKSEKCEYNNNQCSVVS